ncbi:hypothetical protein K437DRAFT_69737 [Tilletiaria anomala UBC 951]|uniref:Uncharacterized protein n=1 Tax=Tilletiaria anomala (strain ATCC 24038 / CBS 436.72 / UBC 951) TaxID=1037660 RepID=A0A066WRV9_TILAU|nr:uncharacterized protein K437DRAFT_69737 [Tilletiaria anomala UBC 951]KDN53385.1 hypothetical protein K437DRAFT_69737 [Tilletiaria anomala UBC 951]
MTRRAKQRPVWMCMRGPGYRSRHYMRRTARFTLAGHARMVTWPLPPVGDTSASCSRLGASPMDMGRCRRWGSRAVRACRYTRTYMSIIELSGCPLWWWCI